MKWRSRRKRLVTFASIAVLLAGLSSFAIARQLFERTDVEAEPPLDQLAPNWYKPLLEADVAAAKINGVMNGIRIGSTAIPVVECNAGEAEDVDPALTASTRIEISPKYLPDGTTLDSAGATSCRGSLIAAGNTYTIEGDRKSGRFGGALTIGRVVGSHDVPLTLTAERAHPLSVSGRAAVLVDPLTEDGWGQSALLIAEDWGMTTLVATGLRGSELIRIAESMTALGGSR